MACPCKLLEMKCKTLGGPLAGPSAQAGAAQRRPMMAQEKTFFLDGVDRNLAHEFGIVKLSELQVRAPPVNPSLTHTPSSPLLINKPSQV